MVLILFFVCIYGDVSAQEVHRAAATYRSSISFEEKRIADIKESLTAESPNFPETIKLFFQELKGNYAVFYDWNGETVYYRYRINKFDKSRARMVRKLAEGAAYEVKGRWEGMIVYQVSTIPLFKRAAEVTLEDKKGRFSIPVFDLENFRELALDEIIY
ncbi:LIC_11959 family protein [Leptospira ainazelensis]|uniref:LIC_11959 family protein n=1 Tax=Leptospira ainazelensis TaxID=2810034 RepID=UPI002FC5D69B